MLRVVREVMGVWVCVWWSVKESMFGRSVRLFDEFISGYRRRR